MLLDTGYSRCCSNEKSPEAGKTDYHDLDSYVPNTYSQKVFIGGLPPDLHAGELECPLAVCTVHVCVCV